VTSWALLVLEALAIGWLVALSDAFWRLRRLLAEIEAQREGSREAGGGVFEVPPEATLSKSGTTPPKDS